MNPEQNTYNQSSNSAINANNKLSTTHESTGIPLEINSASILRNNPANSSLKEQKKNYNLKKRCFTKNIQCAIESTHEVHSGWLKARTTFKGWTKVWCQVKPGYLIMYTSQEAQKKHKLGVILLSVCQAIKRPTKKEGFCFKLINPFGCSVWAKSSTRALAFSNSSLTLRASDVTVGKLWLEVLHRCNLSANLEGYQSVLEEASMATETLQSNRSDICDSDNGDISTEPLECLMLDHSNSSSNNISISSTNKSQSVSSSRPFGIGNTSTIRNLREFSAQNGHASKVDDNDRNIFQKNMVSSPIDRPSSHLENLNNDSSGSKFNANEPSPDEQVKPGAGLNLNSSKMVAKFSKYNWRELQLESVNYASDGLEELGSAGVQSEEVQDGNKNFLWHIIKQLRPGMDLSKVTLPTFILEPRSFLEKLADYYYHCDILTDAVSIDDPTLRLIHIVKWYLSGFYKKPKGPKKPYNPILGERFRCFWDHPKTQSRTFFIAEQVSHHPPISAFHVSNRKDGYTITCALLSRSKFGGNSVSAILDGRAKLYLTKRNETYSLTMPYANCRGILLGSLCLELGGKVEIDCAETGCRSELDFKLAPVWAGANSYNALTGKILKDNKVTHTLDGHWDKKINITDKRTDEKTILWEVTEAVRNSRLKRYTVSMEDQGERESIKLWRHVTEALTAGDQVNATIEKTKLEDIQRREARERQGTFEPEHFCFTPETNEWNYRWKDCRPWNERRDIMQFEENFKIRTLMLDNTTSSTKDRTSKSIPDSYNPNIDMPLTQLSTSSGRHGSLNDSMIDREHDRENIAGGSRSIDTEIHHGMKLMKQAINQVAEKNQKLEMDLAALKQGKRRVAFAMAVIVVAIMSLLFKYFA